MFDLDAAKLNNQLKNFLFVKVGSREARVVINLNKARPCLIEHMKFFIATRKECLSWTTSQSENLKPLLIVPLPWRSFDKPATTSH